MTSGATPIIAVNQVSPSVQKIFNGAKLPLKLFGASLHLKSLKQGHSIAKLNPPKAKDTSQSECQQDRTVPRRMCDCTTIELATNRLLYSRTTVEPQNS